MRKEKFEPSEPTDPQGIEAAADIAEDANDPRRLALDKLLANPAFKTSSRNRDILRYVVEETIAGRGGRIKAYNIATDVLKRGMNFDSLGDPVVRIAVGQIRKALKDFYAQAYMPTMRIEIPLGRYSAQFVAIDSGEEVAMAAEPRDGVQQEIVPDWSETSPMFSASVLATAIIFIGAVAVGWQLF